MDAKNCLKKMELVGVLSFATVDKAGNPQIRCISAIHYEEDSFYFLTARGKNFCQELLDNKQVQILAYTRYKEMIRVSAKAIPVEEQKQEHYLNTIFKEQPYLANVYPGDTRKILTIFEVKDATIEYFNLGVNPIFRETYPIGDSAVTPKGYEITSDCIGCGNCIAHCPQRCIESGTPYQIQQEHCLHCGMCAEVCPVQAIRKVK